MKTAKYYIQFANIDTDMSIMLEISKAEYDKQYRFLLDQLVNTEDYEAPMKHTHYEDEFGGYMQHRDFFTVACADTVLYKQICKDGYRFKTKKEMKK